MPLANLPNEAPCLVSSTQMPCIHTQFPIRDILMFALSFCVAGRSTCRGEGSILANASRLGCSGPWCLAAAINKKGLIASQQLYGIGRLMACLWKHYMRFLNGPLANAYLAGTAPSNRIRRGTVLSVPIPRDAPDKLDELVRQYARVVMHGNDLFSERRTVKADALLNQIDALVLKAYDLPPELERELLEFRGERRPTLHEWTHWLPNDFAPFIPLHRYLSDEYTKAKSS